MKTITAIAILILTAFVVSVSFEAPVEARPHVARNVGKTFNNAARGVYRGARSAGRAVTQSARWGTRALWVGTGVGAGAAAMTRNCNYYYKRYQETHAAKWRNQYNACIR